MQDEKAEDPMLPMVGNISGQWPQEPLSGRLVTKCTRMIDEIA